MRMSAKNMAGAAGPATGPGTTASLSSGGATTPGGSSTPPVSALGGNSACSPMSARVARKLPR
jgi:hypothetical protein